MTCAGRNGDASRRRVSPGFGRGGERPTPRNRTTKALTKSATYNVSPMIPCSAATVTGIVCEAVVAWLATRK